MMYWKREGEQIRQGLTIYHPKHPSSAGGILRIGNHAWSVRYSKATSRWYFAYNKVDPNAMKKWEDFTNRMI